jgi:polar amino acid transport system permease protein
LNKNEVASKIDRDLTKIPGAESSARIDAWWGLVIGVIALVSALCILWPDPFLRQVIFMRDGIWRTIWITITSFILILILGLFGALARISKSKMISGVATLYVEVVRGIPLMVQLLWWYFAFPAVLRGAGDYFEIQFLSQYRASPLVMAIMGLTICYGAYMTEIYRAGIQSIQRGQMEAARSLGMTYFQAMRFVILPQAFRIILPPVGNEFTALLKDSSLVSVVVVADMTRRAREFISQEFNAISGWTLLALLYLILTLISTRVAAWVEKKYSIVQR